MATANNEFFEALSALEKERGLPEDYLIDKIKAAIVIAVKKDYEVEDDNVVVDIDPELGAFRASLLRDIVEEVENPHTQVSLEDAQKVRKSYKVGQRMVTPLKTKEFGRIAAQTAKHVIRQGLREGERNLQCSEMQSRAHELIAATVVSIDPERGNVVLDLGKGGSAVLPRNEQVPGETFTEGQTVQVYVVDVLATDRGPRVTISRTHPGLVKRMFELEVPEIYDGTVEVKAIAREAGARTKLAVWSKNPDVDPVGACIGARGVRVEKIVQELNGEKIDIIPYSEKPEEFIAKALAPANVLDVQILDEEERTCTVKVPNNQLSLAIGNKGQNAKLAAKLTGYKIDIKPEFDVLHQNDAPAEEKAETPVEQPTDAPAETEAAAPEANSVEE